MTVLRGRVQAAAIIAVMAVLGIASCSTASPRTGEIDADDDASAPSDDGSTSASGGAESTGSGTVEEPPAEDPCESRECGADYATGAWCGGPCARGEGCDAAGVCGAWPPDLDAFYNGNESWQLPPCDVGDDPGGDLAGAASYPWVKTMVTTATDCPKVVQDAHPMVQPGNVATEDTSVPVHGSCLNYSDGQWGTAYEGVAVWGASWWSSFAQFTYMINWRAVIDHNASPPSGKGVAHLTRLGGDFACSIEMDVTYERCPDDRQDCGNHPAPF